MGIPKSPDGKQIVTISPSSEGLNTWFHGAGDSPEGRGEGQRFLLIFSSSEIPTTKDCTLQYSEPLELHDGQGIMTPAGGWDVEDCADLYVEIPSSSISTNTGSAGNCNFMALSEAGGIILPAPGDGAFDIDLSTAVPVESQDKSGYWDVDYMTGEITPASEPGQAKFNLFTFPIPYVYMVRRMPLGHGHGVLDVDVYKIQWVHPTWKLHFQVTKNSPGDGKIAMWMLGFRKNITIT